MVIPREPRLNWGLRRDYTPTPQLTKAYLLGVLHDATIRRNTYRIASKSKPFCNFLMKGIKKIGGNAWIYKEGKNRNLWIVEFSKFFIRNVGIKTKQDKIDYIKGYFDAEGGMAKSKIEETGIICGRMHIPSRERDPDYWRFYISSKSYENFARLIGSFHPDKIRLLRKKI